MPEQSKRAIDFYDGDCSKPSLCHRAGLSSVLFILFDDQDMQAVADLPVICSEIPRTRATTNVNADVTARPAHGLAINLKRGVPDVAVQAVEQISEAYSGLAVL